MTHNDSAADVADIRARCEAATECPCEREKAVDPHCCAAGMCAREAEVNEEAEMNEYIDIVFDGPPSHESGRFVEVEDHTGKSISFGEWVHRPDGYWALRINRRLTIQPQEIAEAVTLREREAHYKNRALKAEARLADRPTLPADVADILATEVQDVLQGLAGLCIVHPHHTDLRNAMNVIVKLETALQSALAEVERLKAAVEPFAKAWTYSCHPNAGEGLPWITTWQDYESAARALQPAAATGVEGT